MERMREKILFVDDDPNLLSGIRRQFRGTLNISTSLEGEDGLKILKEEGPFAVVVSDMRMPKMNGIQFLAQAGKLCPDTVRMMLTGNADVETAMHAVNEGNIFRFLVKPCHKDTMTWALEAAVKQYRLVHAERELLEGTLKGSIRVLTDILSLINPKAFSRTARIRGYVREIVQDLGLDNPWQYELAALLSQLGSISIPADVLEQHYAGVELSEDERAMIEQQVDLTGKLLNHIPRLGIVAEMISRQNDNLEKYFVKGELPRRPELIGALILKTSSDFDLLMMQGKSQSEAIGTLRKNESVYPPIMLDALKDLLLDQSKSAVANVKVVQLDSSMTLAEDIRTRRGLLIATRGQRISLSMRRLLENLKSRREIPETIRVYTQTESAEESQEEHLVDMSAGSLTQ